ncbi:MAG: hypothetical protein J0H99_10010, partial [Rhodospirillales bacterium]|nr:hypothetical protein [Rhodospirillales bacterium]
EHAAENDVRRIGSEHVDDPISIRQSVNGQTLPPSEIDSRLDLEIPEDDRSELHDVQCLSL